MARVAVEPPVTQSNSQSPDKVKKEPLSSRIKPQSREFRDALTRATGALRGAATNAKQWDRWTP